MYNYSMIALLFKLATLLMFGRLLYWFYNYISALFFYKRADLLERYGQGSWVVVTGGSEGIGLGIAKEFARLGFNIVLIARNVEKLQAAQIEIKKVNPLSEVSFFSKDFTKSHKQGFFEELEKELEQYDVSVLVNNVGYMTIKSPEDNTIEEIRNMIVVNTCSQVGMSKIFLPKFQKRKFRCAQIDLSSSATITPMPLLNIYGATKCINEFMSMGLSTYVNNTDILSVHPSLVSTSLTDNKVVGNGKLAMKVVSSEDCAQGIVSALTNTQQTFGAFAHELVMHVLFPLVKLIPRDLRRLITLGDKVQTNLKHWKEI
jgi:17beta-estradiol 17-dehydrogenase / very-long-chain 3-oxoacyl-CoA reductase